MDIMTRFDRETLIKIARQRERVAKTEAKERAARLMAEFEKALDRRYHYDENKVWSEANDIANRTVADANRRIAEECGRLGIPAEFAPSMYVGWMDRGRNSMRNERAEMRRVAQKEIEAIEKGARSAIERQSVETQEKIMIGGLSSEDARLFLESMPTAEALMPSLTMERVEMLLLAEPKPN